MLVVYFIEVFYSLNQFIPHNCPYNVFRNSPDWIIGKGFPIIGQNAAPQFKYSLV